MPVVTNFSAASDKGLHRGNNEDSYLSKPEQGLWLIADGMGGHAAGEVASAIVAETIGRRFADQPVDEGALVDSIQQAHQSVLEAVRQGEGAPGMGSTVVALVSTGGEYRIAWVGDSRAYLWTPEARGGHLERLSTDHSYVQMLLASGAIAEEEAANHPERNVITQCIGSPDVRQVQVDCRHGRWRENQWILLCSDGLSDELNDESITGILSASSSVRDAVQRLMREALKHGGRDNITLQIVESPLTRRSRRQALSRRLARLFEERKLSPALYASLGVFLALVLLWLLA